jgi:branched-chain amino acid transport system substrate-binding protein
VQAFVKDFQAKYGQQPDAFSAYAYDALNLTAAVLRKYGASRQAFQAGLSQIKDVPSVIFGKLTFDPVTRRVSGATVTDIVVRDGKWALFDGKAT